MGDYNELTDKHLIKSMSRWASENGSGVVAEHIELMADHIQHLEQRLAEVEEAKQRDRLAAMRNIRRIAKRKRQPNWVFYMELFATGSTTAYKRCEELGLDPDSEK